MAVLFKFCYSLITINLSILHISVKNSEDLKNIMLIYKIFHPFGVPNIKKCLNLAENKNNFLCKFM